MPVFGLLLPARARLFAFCPRRILRVLESIERQIGRFEHALIKRNRKFVDSPRGEMDSNFSYPHESAGFPKARRVSRVALAPAQIISAACAAVLAWVQVEIRLSLLSSPSLPQ